MAVTRIRSKVVSSFIQPNLGEIVSVIINTDINWLQIGVSVYIVSGGVYEIVSVTGNVYNLKLLTSEAGVGSEVEAKILYPVDPQDSGDYNWGIKEW